MPVVKIKKEKAQYSVLQKKKIKDYKTCLEATQFENKINLEKNEIYIDSSIRNRKEFSSNWKAIN